MKLSYLIYEDKRHLYFLYFNIIVIVITVDFAITVARRGFTCVHTEKEHWIFAV